MKKKTSSDNKQTRSRSRRQFIKSALTSGVGVVLSAGLFNRAQAFNYQSSFEYDLIVIGSGAAGMTAALTAATRGLRTLVIEKADKFGGSTARSGGGIWIRNNTINQAAGIEDSPEKAAEYLQAVAGDEVPQAKQAAFLDAGPNMIDLVREQSPLDFQTMEGYSDYYPDFPGAIGTGASIEPQVFDGRELGTELENLAPAYIPTPPGVVVFGGDYKWLTLATVSKQGLKVATQSVARYLQSLLSGSKPLTMGQALAAGLRKGLLSKNVPLWLNTSLLDVTQENGRIDGIIAERNGEQIFVKAHKGVIIASGGFEHNLEMRQKYQKAPITTDWTVGASSNTGDGIRAGERAGAALEFMDDAWWGPSIMLGPNEPYFCLSERSLPGSILVNAAAKRFVNESSPYHDVVNAMYDQKEEVGEISTWMIVDSRYRKRYLFKDVLPSLPYPRAWYDNGALVKSWSLRGLSRKTQLDYETLKDTVERFNHYARQGLDEEFGRGENSYDRYYADPGVEPNPSLAPILKPPFYAFKMVPGDLGTKGGLKTNEHAQVLNANNEVIPGLFAAGNASSPVMGRSYAGAGSTLGPAMTFGFIAAEYIARNS